VGATGGTTPTTIAPAANYQPVFYNTSSSSFVYDTATNTTNNYKTFVIDHPSDADRYLVHGCVEGPEVGVYYRGSSRTDVATCSTVIRLPDYVQRIARDFTINLTAIGGFADLYATRVQNNEFTVNSSKPIEFDYIVYGKRSELITEPLRGNVTLRGDGPYTWIDSQNS
jgi:hypothetical protein